MPDTTSVPRSYVMTESSIDDFLAHAGETGASDNTIRRYAAAARALYAFLPEDKVLTRETLLLWREDLEERGYASITVQNYVKYINCYLDHAGFSEIRFNRGRAKDISGMTFGFLKAIEPTDKRDRKDVVWLCECKCGNRVEIPATRLLRNNTLSCGCINKEHLNRANQYFANTSLRQSLEEKIFSTTNDSGYVGVVKKDGRWQARITYKKQKYILGTYTKLEDAVKARVRGKEKVMEDAAELLKIYEFLHDGDDSLPSKRTEPKQDVEQHSTECCSSDGIAKRSDNTSGHTGVYRKKEKWEARICHKGVRYILGRFELKEDAIAERQSAEKMLKEDPQGFIEKYGEIGKKYRE